MLQYFFDSISYVLCRTTPDAQTPHKEHHHHIPTPTERELNKAVNAADVHAITHIVKQHVYDAALILQALSGLSHVTSINQSHEDDGTFNSHSVNVDVQPIVNAMQRHLEVPMIQVHGLATLLNLSINQSTKIVDCGGVEVIIQCMTEHTDNVSISSSACKVLFNIDKVDERVLSRFCQCGGIDALIDCLIVNFADVDGRVPAVAALSNFVRDRLCLEQSIEKLKENRQLIADTDSIEEMDQLINQLINQSTDANDQSQQADKL